MRYLACAIVSALVAFILLWFGYGEAKRLATSLPKRLRAMRQARDFGRLTPEWQAIVRALDPEAIPKARRLTVAAIATVIPGGHPRLHQ